MKTSLEKVRILRRAVAAMFAQIDPDLSFDPDSLQDVERLKFHLAQDQKNTPPGHEDAPIIDFCLTLVDALLETMPEPSEGPN